MKTFDQQAIVDNARDEAKADAYACLTKAILAHRSLVKLPHVDRSHAVTHFDNSEVCSAIDYWVDRAILARSLLSDSDWADIYNPFDCEEYPRIYNRIEGMR